MTSTTAAAKVVVGIVQALMVLVNNYLQPGAHYCPTSTNIAIAANKSYDMVIVGGGTAGSALVSRLAKENRNMTIVVIEEGPGCPPIESMLPGWFPLLVDTVWDRRYTIHNDGYSCQNILPNALTSGKGLGGSSMLNHLISVSCIKNDYTPWGIAAKDPTWSDMGKYFAIGETAPEDVIRENATMHGTSGPRFLSRQMSSSLNNIISAFIEKGYKHVHDAMTACKVSIPLLNIGHKIRQSGAVCYLSELVDNDKVTFITAATANKIIFNDKTATGVEVISGEDSYIIRANKIINLSMGTLRTPQLLMVSGIGKKEHLKENNITLVQHNPHVGENLMDHTVMLFSICMENSTKTASTNPFQWPVDVLTSYGGPVCDGPITYQSIMLPFTPHASGFSQLCGTVFKYKNEICDSLYGCCGNKTQMVVILSLSHPKSKGRVSLKSKNMTDDPDIELNVYKNKVDLKAMVESGMEFTEILNTSVFQEMGATLCDAGLCTNFTKGSYEFWECYALATSTTLWHYSGTCALGTVVDKNLMVKGTKNLMIADASIFPSMPSANPEATVYAVAERAAEIILKSMIIKGDDKSKKTQKSTCRNEFP